MKKLTKAICITMLISLLGGCYPSEQRTKPSRTESVYTSVGSLENSNSKQDVGTSFSDSQAVHLQAENLLLDFNAPTDVPNVVSSLKLTLKKWDTEQMKNVLLKDNKITEEYEYDCQFYPNEKHYGFDTARLNVFWEPGKFGFSDKSALGGEFKYGTVYYYATEDFAANDDELSKFSRNDAVRRVNEFLEKIGVTNYGEPKISPIKADFANEILIDFKKRIEETGEAFDYTPWTEAEECYYLRYPLIYNNLELSTDMISIPKGEWGVIGTYIEAVVSKNNIIRVMGNDIYSENIEKSDEISINCNFNQALEKLKNYYSNLVLDNSITFYNCKLIYFPDDVSDDRMTVTFMPAWRFNGYSQLEEMRIYKSKHQQHQYFYANNGYRYIGSE